MKPTKRVQHTLTIAIIVFFALSSITVYSVRATDGISVPPPTTIITIEVANGTSSYFLTTLSDVPLGYDVTNTAYLGWCIDVNAQMGRSPATHQVVLYSSLNPPNGTLKDQRWDLVNYILNHKKQGTADDIQAAIWYFIHFDNATETPPSNQTVAWAIINDTLANGTGYTPTSGQAVAVICNPITFLPGNPVQISIIEVTVPVIPEYPTIAITILTLTATSIGIIYAKKTIKPHNHT
jgi:hypothetical protein